MDLQEDEFVMVPGGKLIAYKGSDSNVKIPGNVTSTVDGAFAGNERIRKVTVPGTVKTIGNNAFAFSGVEEVVLEYGVESIGEYVFGTANNLKKVTIPESVTSIGRYVFDLEEGTRYYTITVYCKENSLAHRYAVDNKQNISFIK